MIRQLGHVALAIKDLDRSLQFYCNGLGLNEAFRLNHDDGSPWIVYLATGNGTFIELFPSPPAVVSRPTEASLPSATEASNVANVGSCSSFQHLCLLVNDVHEADATLRRAGIEPDGPATRGKDHNWQLWVTDPDGTRIELMQIDSDSPQARSSS